MTHVAPRTLLLGSAGAAAGARKRPTMARVKVAPERVIVVRGEKLDGKTLIHDYGHGGAGITLSWETSQLAVTEGAKGGARDCAVVGCGVVGLTTARLLQLRGYNPVIYAKAMPPDTTSNVVGRLWEPASVFAGGGPVWRAMAAAELAVRPARVRGAGAGQPELRSGEAVPGIAGAAQRRASVLRAVRASAADNSVYMFPQRDGILLGGTFDRGISTLEPETAITDRIVRENSELFGRMRA